MDGELPGGALADEHAAEAKRRVEERLRGQLDGLWKHRGNDNSATAVPSWWPKTLFMHSERGISAIHALRRVISLSQTDSHTDSSAMAATASEVRSRAFQEFQERYVASNLGDVSQSLIADIRSLTRTPAVGPTNGQETISTSTGAGIQTFTAEHVLLRSLHYIDTVLTNLTAQSIRVEKEAIALREAAEDEERDILLLASTTWRRALETEMQRTRDAVARVLGDRFGGWRVLTGRAERVEEEVGGQVVAHWGYALTQQVSCPAG